jgi:predicted DNA-binding transcriptional regulator YafY
MIVKQRKPPTSSLTPDRVARLYRLVRLLGTGPKTRQFLLRKLKVDTRGFYRDFERMRAYGVAMEMHAGRYVLMEAVAQALARLPFPDPELSVQEVLLLAVGKTPAHKKLRERIEAFLGHPARR